MENQEQQLAEAIKQKVQELNELNLQAFKIGLNVSGHVQIGNFFDKDQPCVLDLTIAKYITY